MTLPQRPRWARPSKAWHVLVRNPVLNADALFKTVETHEEAEAIKRRLLSVGMQARLERRG